MYAFQKRHQQESILFFYQLNKIVTGNSDNNLTKEEKLSYYKEFFAALGMSSHGTSLK